MSRLRLLAIVLLVVGAALFVIGTSIEKGRHHDEPAAGAPSGGSETHNEGGESAEQREVEQAARHSDVAGSEGTILGVDVESTGLVVFAVTASLALAAMLWRRPTRATWFIAGAVALVFAVFDVAEIVHQLDESAVGLATLAAAVALAHVATSGIAATELRTS